MNTPADFDTVRDRQKRRQRSEISRRELKALGMLSAVYSYMVIRLVYALPDPAKIHSSQSLGIAVANAFLALMYVLALYKLWNTASAGLTRLLSAPCVIFTAFAILAEVALGRLTPGLLLLLCANLFAIATLMYLAYLRTRFAHTPAPSRPLTADEWLRG